MRMIDRQKKKFIVLVIGLILYFANVTKSQHFAFTKQHFRQRRLLTMTKKPCQDAEGNRGVCIFKWDCISQDGVSLSTCVDGFLFGSCCKLKVDTEIFPSQTENRVDFTADYVKPFTIDDDPQLKKSSVPEWKTSNTESYDRGVMYGFHREDIDLEGQNGDFIENVPVIFTLAEKFEKKQTEKGEKHFPTTSGTTESVSDLETTAAEDAKEQTAHAQTTVEEAHSNPKPMHDVNSNENENSSVSGATTTLVYNTGNVSLAAVSLPTNIPIVYTLSSRIPVVHSNVDENNNTLIRGNNNESQEILSSKEISTATFPQTSTTLGQNMSHVTEFPEHYPTNKIPNNVNDFWVSVDSFPILNSEENISTPNSDSYEDISYSTTFTIQAERLSEETEFPFATDEMEETTPGRDFTESGFTKHETVVGISAEHELFTETVTIRNAQDTSPEFSDSPSAIPLVQNETQTYQGSDDAHKVENVSPFTVVLTQNDTFETSQEEGFTDETTQQSNVGTASASNLMVEFTTTSSLENTLSEFNNYESAHTFGQDNYIASSDNGTKLKNNPNLDSENNAIKSETQEIPLIDNNNNYSQIEEVNTVLHHTATSASPLDEEYYNVSTSPDSVYNTTSTKIVFDLSPFFQKSNSSLLSIEDPSFDSTWFLIKLSELFSGNFTFNNTVDFDFEQLSHTTTSPYYGQSGNTEMKLTTYPMKYPGETHVHNEDFVQSILITSDDSLASTSITSGVDLQTDTNDRDGTIYQNLLSIIEYNTKTTAAADYFTKNILKVNDAFEEDIHHPEKISEIVTPTDNNLADMDSEVKEKTNTIGEFSYTEILQQASTETVTSSTDTEMDRTTDFTTSLVQSTVDVSSDFIPGNGTRHTFPSSEPVNTNEEMLTVPHDYASESNSSDATYNSDDPTEINPPNSSLFNSENILYQFPKDEANISLTLQPLITKTPVTTAITDAVASHSTKNHTLSETSPESMEYDVSELSPGSDGTTKETTFETPPGFASSVFDFTDFFSTHVQNVSHASVSLTETKLIDSALAISTTNFTDGISTDSEAFISTAHITEVVSTDSSVITSADDFINTSLNSTAILETEPTTKPVRISVNTQATTRPSTISVDTQSTFKPAINPVITEAATAPTIISFNTELTTWSTTILPIAQQTTKPTTILPNAQQTTKPTTILPNAQQTTKPTTILPNAQQTTKPTTILPNAQQTTKPTTILPNAQQTTKPTTISRPTTSTPTFATQKSTTTSNLPLPPKLDYRKNCGVRTLRPHGRIVGGTNTFFGKWPWQALVKEATWWGLFVKNKCGGVLINSKYVITAAHCQPGFLGTLIVVLGAHDLTGAEDSLIPVARNVKRMVIHRHYNAQTFENDLALLEMESPVDFLPHVVPICLPHRQEDFTGKMAFVTGWGKLTHGGDVPNILQEVQVPIVTNTECQRMYLYAGHEKMIRSHFVCAGYSRGGQDSCEGDSGGPLMVQRDDGRWVLVGTVSHGIGCADPNLPGVYMRMSAYKPWIDSVIRRRKVVRHKNMNNSFRIPTSRQLRTSITKF